MAAVRGSRPPTRDAVPERIPYGWGSLRQSGQRWQAREPGTGKASLGLYPSRLAAWQRLWDWNMSRRMASGDASPWPLGPDTPLREVARAFAADRAEGREPSTRRDYLVDRFVVTIDRTLRDGTYRGIGRTPIRLVTLPAVREWVRRLEEDGVSASQIIRGWQTVKGALVTAQQAGLTDATNPLLTTTVRDLRLYSTRTASDHFLFRLGEWAAVTSALSRTPRGLVLRTCAWTGLRPQAVMALERRSLSDDAPGWLWLSGGISLGERRPGKGTNKRDTYLPLPVWQDLADHRTATEGRPDALLLPGVDGEPLPYHTITTEWRCALRRLPDAAAAVGSGDEQAWLPGRQRAARPYDLRSNYVSWLLMAGVDEGEVQQQVGHALGSDVTTRIYRELSSLRRRPPEVGLLRRSRADLPLAVDYLYAAAHGLPLPSLDRAEDGPGSGDAW